MGDSVLRPLALCQHEVGDSVALMITPAQCRAARAVLRMNIREVAAAARVDKNTISRFECEHRDTDPECRVKIQLAFEERGIVFLEVEDNGQGEGLRFGSLIARCGYDDDSTRHENPPSQ